MCHEVKRKRNEGCYLVIELEEQYEQLRDEVYQTIKDFAAKNHLDVDDTVLYNLAIHLSLSIARETTGSFIDTSSSQLASCKTLSTYPIAKEVIKTLNKDYQIELPQSDIGYCAMYLANKSLLDLDFNVESDIVDHEMEEIMDETLDEIKNKLGYDLRTNQSFVQGMTLHFYPAIERLENNEQLSENPMVKEISANELPYKCANILNEVVEKHYKKSFNENELSYITLHFGVAFYNQEA
jgi:transcriptional antiterminator